MKQLGVLILILVTSVLISAQGETKKTVDFSGTWVLDKTKSDAGSGLRVTFNDTTLVVVHGEREIKMTTKIKSAGKESVSETVYYLDGRDDDKRPDSNGEQRTTKWDGKKLVIKGKTVVRAITVGGSHPIVENKQEWTLSKDGNTLTRSVSSSGFPGMQSQKSKFVFTRVMR